MPIELNAVERERFGIVTARVKDLKASPQAVNSAAEAVGVQMLTIRLDCTDHAHIHAVEADNFRLMDTLVYYERSLSDPTPEYLPASDVMIRHARPGDAGAVAEVARAAFFDYIGHFHADPRLQAEDADATYVDWARKSVVRHSDIEQAWVVFGAGRLAGFLTLRRNDHAEYEIVLNAVHPDLQRRGLYERLLNEALVASQKADAERIIVSTQLNNFRVQRAWVKLGFRLTRAVHTFHKWYF